MLAVTVAFSGAANLQITFDVTFMIELSSDTGRILSKISLYKPCGTDFQPSDDFKTL